MIRWSTCSWVIYFQVDSVVLDYLIQILRTSPALSFPDALLWAAAVDRNLTVAERAVQMGARELAKPFHVVRRGGGINIPMASYLLGILEQMNRPGSDLYDPECARRLFSQMARDIHYFVGRIQPAVPHDDFDG